MAQRKSSTQYPWQVDLDQNYAERRKETYTDQGRGVKIYTGKS